MGTTKSKLRQNKEDLEAAQGVTQDGKVLANNRGTGWKDMDVNRCPSGANPDIWHLVLVFEQKAGEDEIVLAVGRSILYAQLKRALEISGAMDDEGTWTNEQLQLQFEFIQFCWWEGERPHMRHEVEVYALAGPRWRRAIELMIVEFWNYYRDEYAMEMFTEFNGHHGFRWNFDKLTSRMECPTFRDAWRRELASTNPLRVSSPVGGDQ